MFALVKSTDKTTEAFEATLALIDTLLTGGPMFEHGCDLAARRVGERAARAVHGRATSDSPELLALRDLVQAAADERATSATSAARSAAVSSLDLFSVIKERHDTAVPNDCGVVPNAHADRAWLIGEVERLRRAASIIDKQ